MAEPDFSKRIVYHVDGMRDVRVRRDVVYKRDAGTELKMNIYSPARLSGDARVPAVFFVHGGPIPARSRRRRSGVCSFPTASSPPRLRSSA